MLGPTASGKSQLALALAERLGAPLLSVDSMQVYRDMDIGTAKASAADRRRVEHHLIDLVEPDVEYALADFQRIGNELLDDIGEAPAVVAGGSGLYFRSLVDAMTLPPADEDVRRVVEGEPMTDLVTELRDADPEVAQHLDLANPHRVARAVEILRLTGQTPSARSQTAEYRAWAAFEPVRPFVAVGIDPGPEIVDRVERRFDRMVDRGLVAEVASLRGRMSRTASQAVGYKELLPVVTGEVSLGSAREHALTATRALAKRQRTFFRKDPRIRWIEWHDDPETRFARMRSRLELAA